MGILSDDLLDRFIKIFSKNTGNYITLFDNNYEIVSIEYEKIRLKENEATDKVKVYFNSTTYFTLKAKPEPMLFPDPKYFFMNLLNIWNEFNPEAKIPEGEAYTWIDRNIVINDYATFTKRVFLSKSRPINGFKGWVVYRFKENTAFFFWIKVLLEYSRYSNVGGNRTGGMGVVDYRWLRKKNEKKTDNIKDKEREIEENEMKG